MANKENQEALTLLTLNLAYVSYPESLLKYKKTLQQAIDRLEEDEKLIEDLCVANEKLTEEKVNFEMALELLIKDYLKAHPSLELNEDQVKNIYLKAVGELENVL